MKLNDGYKLMFNVESWGSYYAFDRSKIHAYIQYYKTEGTNPLVKMQRYELRPCTENDFKEHFE